MGQGRGRGGVLHSQEGSSFLELQGTWKEQSPPRVAHPLWVVASQRGKPSAFFLFCFEADSEATSLGSKGPRVTERAVPSIKLNGGQCPIPDWTRGGTAKRAAGATPIPHGRSCQPLGPGEQEAKAPTVPSVPSWAQLPSAPPPALCFLTRVPSSFYVSPLGLAPAILSPESG